MTNLFILNILLFLGVLLLSVLIFLKFQTGNFGEIYKKVFKTESLLNKLLLVIITVSIIMLLIQLFSAVIYYLILFSGLAYSEYVLENTVPNGQDPVSWLTYPEGGINSINRLSVLPIPEWFDNLIKSINFNGIIYLFLYFFKPVKVEGHLDDLLGQQLFIHFLLIIVVIGLIILFCIYFYITIMLNNKDYILKRFNNKFILFYLKYQLFLAKLSQFTLPLLILLGLLELLVMSHFLITHPIPYEQLPIDLHTFVKR